MDSKLGRKFEIESISKTTSRETLLSNETNDRKRLNSSPIKSNFKDEGEELPLKKPRLLVDTSANCQPLCEALSSNESFISGVDNDSSVPVASGLSAYLEDIISDEEPLEETTPPSAKTSTPQLDTPTLRSKEELLLLMERVDRDIASIEQQISVLEKRQENTQSQLMCTPSSSVTPSTLSSVINVSSSFISSSSVGYTSSSAPLSSHHHHHHNYTSLPMEHTVLETIYHENRMKARSNQMTLFGNDKMGFITPTYFQPCELPQIVRNRQRHKLFFPKLVTYLKKRKLTKHLKEVSLCEEYERYSNDWEKRLERWTQSAKKKHRDARNKEMFEKMFPELRSKRDQLRDEAYSRVGVRSFGVVRSEAELNQLACELFEQDEARGRCRLTHAVLPSMLISEKERSVQFINSNGLITDPMSVHREAKNVNNWSEEEKKIFKEKFILFPKNFEKIASFLPHKSMNECVRYYYLVKKKEHFKQLIRRSSFKRRRLNKHQSEYSLNSSTILGGHNRPHPKPHLTSSEGHSSAPPSVMTSPTITPSQSLTTIKSPTGLPEYDGWTEKEIASLKEGLCKYGRAWGKVYREVGGRKSATQCKQFYDTYCTDRHLQLNSALAEHSSKKNAEKVKKKMEEMKKQATPLSQAQTSQSLTSTAVINKKRSLQQQLVTTVHSRDEEEEDEDESDDSDGSESDDRSDSDSETTLTDSGSEDRPTPSSNTTTITNSASGGRGTQHKPLRLSIDSTRHSVDSLQSPLDIFLSAAEALSNTVPVEIALHDHTYPRPPMEIQGSSGLQLIAAAAAVISPGLSKTSSNKVPFSTKAPRGRPPSQQKRGSNYSQKLAPTYLTPTSGTSHNILLQDFKPSLRNRSRSAPTEKTRPTVLPPHPYGNKPLPYPTQTVKPPNTRTTTNATYRTATNTVSSKDINFIASLKPTSISNGHGVSNLLEATTMSGGNGSNISHHDRSVHSPVLSYPLINSSNVTTTTGTTKTHRKDSSNTSGTVFELNLGNMALLLAATGTNQQAALLLPQSTLLNKQALAMLQSGSVCITDSGATATINIDPSVLASSSISNGNSNRPKTTDVIHPNVTNNKNTMIIKPSTLNVAVATKDTMQPSSKVSTAPPSNDLTNLNLLSNLVAGLPKKSDTAVTSQSNTITNTNKVTRKNDDKIENAKPMVIHRNSIAATTSAVTSSSYPITTSSQQQSLMLYARSLTMPLNTTSSQSPDEVDSLEYATRGISELTKLLGGATTDNGLHIPSPSSSTASTKWSPDDLLCNPYNEHTPHTSVHTITSSLTASSSVMTDYLAPPTHQLSLSTRTPTPINALTEDTS